MNRSPYSDMPSLVDHPEGSNDSFYFGNAPGTPYAGAAGASIPPPPGATQTSAHSPYSSYVARSPGAMSWAASDTATAVVPQWAEAAGGTPAAWPRNATPFPAVQMHTPSWANTPATGTTAWTTSESHRVGSPEYPAERVDVMQTSVNAQTPTWAQTTPSKRSSRSHKSSRSPQHGGNWSIGAVLAKRPSDWRPDFHVRTPVGLAALLPRRKSQNGYEMAEPGPKVRLHQFLQYVNTRPPLHFDVRVSTIDSLHLRPGVQIISDLWQYACDPPISTQILLFTEKLPWYIPIVPRDPTAGITIVDLFQGMLEFLSSELELKDLMNDETKNVDREDVFRARRKREREAIEPYTDYARKMDYLRGYHILEGFQRAKNGTWEMKMVKPRNEPPMADTHHS